MLYYGDFYICASERQRDFWLGMLAALNRVNPYSYNQDHKMRKLIDVVPFGLSSRSPMHTSNVIKGVIPGIGKDDFVIIWGGGIYNWFDPLTLIKAMSIVAAKRSDIKLFFLGVKHPNPQVKELSLVNDTVALSDKLGLTGKSVFFNFGWVDYEARQDYFLESDAGIITHPEHIETRFSFRTRILDYLWTGLPVISTKGDSLSELVKNEGLGLTVDEKDAVGLAGAIIKMAQDKNFYRECKNRVPQVASEFTWEKVCAPLVSFCMDPVSSAVRKKLRADQIHTQSGAPNIEASMMQQGSASAGSTGGSRSKGYLIKRFFYHLFKSGPKKTLEYSSNILRK
jgi:glycosyltransferase involved in cell wall biosynthesis